MQDTDAMQRRGDNDEVTADKASMRLALEGLGTRSGPAPRAIGGGTKQAFLGLRTDGSFGPLLT